MKDLILSLFGAYTPVMSGEAVAFGLAGVDWPWVAGVLLFAIVLYSFFRLVGVLLK